MNKIASIIIPHHNRKDHLQKLLSRISSEFEVIVSSGGTFAENCNRGAKKATTNHFIFCNDDCLPSNEDLQEINNWLWTVDVVGSTQVYTKKDYYFGLGFRYDGNPMIYRPQIMHEENLSLFPSAFLLGVTSECWNKLGGFDERFINGYEDVDFGIRCIENSISMMILPLDVYHHLSQSSGRYDNDDDNKKLFNKLYNQEKLKQLYENTNYCF